MATDAPDPLDNIVVLEPYNGGLAVTRALVRAGLRPTLLLTDELEWMAASRGTDARVVGEPAEQGFATALAELGERPGLIVTGADRGTEWLAAQRAALPATLRTFEGEGSGHTELIGKDTSYRIAAEAGVRVPWERSAATDAQLADVAADAPYPCVLKPVVSHLYRVLFGDERVFVVHDARQARERAAPALAAGMPMMLSEYVPGGDDDVEEAIMVRAADGTYPVQFGCRKIRQYPSGFGAASLCESHPIPESMELAQAVLDRAGFVGVVGVETKRHAETGERYFIEANVRLPTQWGLGDASGAQASRRMVGALAGEELGPAPAQRPGVRLVFPELELRGALKTLRATPMGSRPAVARELLRSYRGTRELGLLDLRDPGPLALRVVGQVRKRLG
jgi:predicted ATP-grasp superfamily ATP-dependent carboligase